MDLKEEFKEYRKIYNIYYDELESLQVLAEKKKKEIILKDKEDIQMQLDSKEKAGLLEDYMLNLYKLGLLQVDISKLAERLLYINEASIRNNDNLELTEEDQKFIKGLSMNQASSYAVTNGKVVERVEGLDDIIRKQVSSRPDMIAQTMKNIRETKEYKEN